MGNSLLTCVKPSLRASLGLFQVHSGSMQGAERRRDRCSRRAALALRQSVKQFSARASHVAVVRSNRSLHRKARVWIGCAEPTLHGFMPAVIQRLAQGHPKVVVHAADVNPAENEFQRLRDRRLDLMIGRSAMLQGDDDLHVEKLFEESFSAVTAAHNPWARRRKVTLAELMNESWIFGEPSNATQALISEVFRAKGEGIPPIKVYTTSMNLRLALLASGNYISCIPSSTYRYGAQGRPLKALPVDMGLKLPIAIFTLKNRTLSPVVQLFIDNAREVAKSMAKDA